MCCSTSSVAGVTAGIEPNPTRRERTAQEAVLSSANTWVFVVWFRSAGTLSIHSIRTGVVAIPAMAYWRTAINRVFLFWFAYVFTRPFGAFYADWLGKDRRLGGLAVGDGTVSVLLAAATVAVVVYVVRTRRDVQPRAAMLA